MIWHTLLPASVQPESRAESLVRGAAVLAYVGVSAILVGEALEEGGAAHAPRDVTNTVFAFDGLFCKGKAGSVS